MGMLLLTFISVLLWCVGLRYEVSVRECGAIFWIAVSNYPQIMLNFCFIELLNSALQFPMIIKVDIYCIFILCIYFLFLQGIVPPRKTEEIWTNTLISTSLIPAFHVFLCNKSLSRVVIFLPSLLLYFFYNFISATMKFLTGFPILVKREK